MKFLPKSQYCHKRNWLSWPPPAPTWPPSPPHPAQPPRDTHLSSAGHRSRIAKKYLPAVSVDCPSLQLGWLRTHLAFHRVSPRGEEGQAAMSMEEVEQGNASTCRVRRCPEPLRWPQEKGACHRGIKERQSFGTLEVTAAVLPKEGGRAEVPFLTGHGQHCPVFPPFLLTGPRKMPTPGLQLGRLQVPSLQSEVKITRAAAPEPVSAGTALRPSRCLALGLVQRWFSSSWPSMVVDIEQRVVARPGLHVPFVAEHLTGTPPCSSHAVQTSATAPWSSSTEPLPVFSSFSTWLSVISRHASTWELSSSKGKGTSTVKFSLTFTTVQKGLVMVCLCASHGQRQVSPSLSFHSLMAPKYFPHKGAANLHLLIFVAAIKLNILGQTLLAICFMFFPLHGNSVLGTVSLLQEISHCCDSFDFVTHFWVSSAVCQKGSLWLILLYIVSLQKEKCNRGSLVNFLPFSLLL